MSEELMRETNELMKRLLELRAEDAVEREKQRAEAEKQMADWKTEQSKDEFKFPAMEDFQEKHKARMEEIGKQAEEGQARETKYREELLSELRRQNELLERIAGLLGR